MNINISLHLPHITYTIVYTLPRSQVRVYAPEMQINHTRLALAVCTSVISHFESQQMFGIKFPMDKIGQWTTHTIAVCTTGQFCGCTVCVCTYFCGFTTSYFAGVPCQSNFNCCSIVLSYLISEYCVLWSTLHNSFLRPYLPPLSPPPPSHPHPLTPTIPTFIIADTVAIRDFAAGAMENWGLVTFRESAILFDDQQSTYHNRIRVASVIAHEFAHQVYIYICIYIRIRIRIRFECKLSKQKLLEYKSKSWSGHFSLKY